MAHTSTLQQAVLIELERILSTATQINHTLERCIALLAEAPDLAHGNFRDLVATNSAAVQQLLAMLGTQLTTANADSLTPQPDATLA